MQERLTEQELKQDEQDWQSWWEDRESVNYKRILKQAERKRRGCDICAHLQKKTRGEAFGEKRVDDLNIKKSERIYLCPFVRCPLHELDRYRDYGAYCRAKREENERLMHILFNLKVRKNMKKRLDTKPKIPRKFLDSRRKWLIGCRDNQGYSIEDIAKEFKISEEQAAEVIEEFRNSR